MRLGLPSLMADTMALRHHLPDRLQMRSKCIWNAFEMHLRWAGPQAAPCSSPWHTISTRWGVGAAHLSRNAGAGMAQMHFKCIWNALLPICILPKCIIPICIWDAFQMHYGPHAFCPICILPICIILVCIWNAFQMHMGRNAYGDLQITWKALGWLRVPPL